MNRGSLAVTVALLIAPIRGSADPDDDKQRAAELFAEGRELASAHDDAGACAKFTAAITLDPDAVGTMLNLGLCSQALDKLTTALYWFRRAEEVADARHLAQSAQSARQYAATVVDLVPNVFLEIVPKRGVRIELDGKALDPRDHIRIEIDPGDHVIDAKADGYQPYHLDFHMSSTERRTLSIALVAEPRPELAAHTALATEPPSHRRRAAVYVGSAGGAAIAAGMIVVVYAKHEYNECVADDVPLPRCTNSGLSGVAGANHYTAMARWVATPLVGGGIATLGIATYLYFAGPEPVGARQTRWVPLIDRDQIGIATLVSF